MTIQPAIDRLTAWNEGVKFPDTYTHVTLDFQMDIRAVLAELARLRAATMPTQQWHVQISAPINRGDAQVIYKGEDGKVWAIPLAEVHDGRFVALAATTPTIGMAEAVLDALEKRIGRIAWIAAGDLLAALKAVLPAAGERT